MATKSLEERRVDALERIAFAIEGLANCVYEDPRGNYLRVAKE